MSAALIEAVRERMIALLRADQGADGSPLVEIWPGGRSTEIRFTARIAGAEGYGVIAIGAQEMQPGRRLPTLAPGTNHDSQGDA